MTTLTPPHSGIPTRRSTATAELPTRHRLRFASALRGDDLAEGYAQRDWRSAGYRSWYSRNQVLEWIYEYNLREKIITRNSEYEGQSYNCSYLLIVRKPTCVVRRRLFDPRNGRSNPDDSNAPYEIFPPGVETSFSRMDVSSYNKFELDPTIRL